ncbi:alternative ribosome rescue factor ArfA [Candidatus Pelagibacter sp.]|nr:alternative ribosome rescue factor ArfA [Candidatus Pelagibacter sp.]
MKKKNFIAKNLKSPMYRIKKVKPKRGKGSFKRKKN